MATVNGYTEPGWVWLELVPAGAAGWAITAVSADSSSYILDYAPDKEQALQCAADILQAGTTVYSLRDTEHDVTVWVEVVAHSFFDTAVKVTCVEPNYVIHYQVGGVEQRCGYSRRYLYNAEKAANTCFWWAKGTESSKYVWAVVFDSHEPADEGSSDVRLFATEEAADEFDAKLGEQGVFVHTIKKVKLP